MRMQRARQVAATSARLLAIHRPRMALVVASRTLRTDTRHWWTHMRQGSWLLWCYQTARRAFQYASPVWRPNPRLLFCGMVGFLWDRERIPVEDVMRCLEDYENRLRWQLHSEQATIASNATGGQMGGGMGSTSQSRKGHCSRGNSLSSAYIPCDAQVSCNEATMDMEGEDPRATQSQCSEKNGLGTSVCDSDDGGVDGLEPQSEDMGDGLCMAMDRRSDVVDLEVLGNEVVLGNEDSLADTGHSSGEFSSCYICEGVELSKEQLLRIYEERLGVGLGTTSTYQDGDVSDASVLDGDLVSADVGGTDVIPDLPVPSLDTSHVPRDTSRDKELEERSPLVEQKDPLSGWEFMAEQENCKVYKMPHEETGLNKYKVIGAYDDITAKDFLDIQVDHDARKEWDAYVVKLATVDEDPASGCEVIHWIMKYPFPMQNREYVYVRKFWVNRTGNAIVLINRSVTHPSIPESRRYVRVHRYFSEMVIKPYTFVDELGFNFELTYFDDPQSYLPSSCVNWVTTTAMPDFLNQIHNAALTRVAAGGDVKKHSIGE